MKLKRPIEIRLLDNDTRRTYAVAYHPFGKIMYETGPWKLASIAKPEIQLTIIGMLIRLNEIADGHFEFDPETDVVLVLTKKQAYDVATSEEFMAYANRGWGQVMIDLCRMKNPNRKYGLPERIYGVRIIVEDTPDTPPPLPIAEEIPEPFIAREIT